MRRKGERKTYLVRPHPDGGWRVQGEGARRAASVHRTKPEAVAAAKEKAKGLVHQVGGPLRGLGFFQCKVLQGWLQG